MHSAAALPGGTATPAAAAAAHDWHAQLCPLPLACPSWLHHPKTVALVCLDSVVSMR